ncbi:MAG TPA: threonine/serine dehydratase [Nitrososphaerales archaeon]|nr:threonine/serine dehydratase [Nitrososphaerales archaeon]
MQKEESGQAPVTLEDIRDAARRIQGYAYRTPCYRSFSAKKGSIFLKLECFQPVRSFKIRGASNKILLLNEAERKNRGVITASSGNHGLAVAYVANKLGIPATIVLPEDVVPEKLEIIKSLGARTVFAGIQQDVRAAKAVEIQQKEGQFFIQPFNDSEIVAGQGTCGLEILEDVPDVENIYVPIGGGGLISGIAAAVRLICEERPIKQRVKIIGVQPEGSNSMYSSLRAKQVVSIDESKTVADGLRVRRPGDITFSFVNKYVDDIILVSDEEILAATTRLIVKEHVLAEPSGAASFAAALKAQNSGKSITVISGGNVSATMLKRLLETSEEESKTN